MKEQTILALIESIYRSATEPGLLPQALAEIAKAVGAHSANSVRAGSAEVDDGYYHAHGSPQPSFDSYLEYYHRHDLWHQASLSLGPNPPAVLKGEELVEPAVFERSEFFNDFLRPFNIQRFSGIVIRPDPLPGRSGMNTHFGFYRAIGAAPFGQEEARLLELLIPHLRRACSIQLRLAESQALRTASLESLDLLPLGVVLLDAAGTALFHNRAAGAIIRKGDGFALDGKGYCRAASPSETTALQKLIREATLTGGGNHAFPGGGMRLSRKDSDAALSILVSPLRNAYFGLSRRPCAVLFIGDPDQNRALPADLLSRLYGLSPAEAQLTVALTAGTTLNEFADARGVSLNTVRSQFKQVLRKTGTRRQAELVRLILTGPALLGRALPEEPGM